MCRNRPVVDMVVDPVLGRHLRPHQWEGVCFLYECVMQMKQYEGCGAILADEMYVTRDGIGVQQIV
jgi:DNA repair and recombination protein RAD54B